MDPVNRAERESRDFYLKRSLFSPVRFTGSILRYGIPCFFLSHLLLQSDHFKKIAHCNTKEVSGRRAEYPKQHAGADKGFIISRSYDGSCC